MFYGFVRGAVLCLFALALLSGGHVFAQRQQVNIGGPFRGVNDNFFERSGVNFQLNGPGFFFNQGGFPLAVPQFGGFQPNAGAAGGFAVGGNGFNGRVGFEFSQGSRRSNVTQAASVTMMNGSSGLVSDTSQSPFVVSFGPPPLLARPGGAGGGLPWKQQMSGVIPKQEPKRTNQEPQRDPSPRNAQDEDGRVASAGAIRPRGDAVIRSVAEIRRERAAEEDAANAKARANLQLGREAEAKGNLRLARSYYRIAASQAVGELKQEIARRLEKLTNRSTP